MPTHHLGVLVRSDKNGTDVIGSSGSPTTLGVAYTAQSDATDLRVFGSASWLVYVDNKGTATRLDLTVEWSEDEAAFNSQPTEVISSGVATISKYETQMDISAEVAPFVSPVIRLPAAARYAKVSVKVDAGTTTEAYVRVWRKE